MNQIRCIFIQYGRVLKLLTLVLIALAAGWLAYLIIPWEVETLAAKETLVTKDGNFLFYNGPVAVQVDEEIFLSYLTSEGQIVLNFFKHDRLIESRVIHDYASQIDTKRGRADDHAAPAIIHDPGNRRLLLATAYHGTDMHVYAYSFDTGSVDLLSVWAGRYTYPRFVSTKDDIVLLARKQPDGIMGGDLVSRVLSDSFQEETVIVSSRDGFVVYAGSPAKSDEGFYIAYSLHSYAERRLIGLRLINFDLKKNKKIGDCDLEKYLDVDYFSNRPTGLGAVGKTVMLGTAYYKRDDVTASEKKGDGPKNNTVMILKGEVEKCDSFDIFLKQESVNMPYYDTAVAINDFGDYLFFDNDQVFTSWHHGKCFRREKMIYPNFMEDDGVFYATMNSSYSIRNFHNSLFACIRH